MMKTFILFPRKNRLYCAARVENAAILLSPLPSLILMQLLSIFALEQSSQIPVLHATIAQTSPLKRRVQVDISVGMEAWNHNAVRYE